MTLEPIVVPVIVPVIVPVVVAGEDVIGELRNLILGAYSPPSLFLTLLPCQMICCDNCFLIVTNQNTFSDRSFDYVDFFL